MIAVGFLYILSLPFEVTPLSGSSLLTKKLKNIDLDEEKRKVIGLSGFKRCVFYLNLQSATVIEGRHTDKKGGAQVVAVMHEDGINTETGSEYNIDTINRYQYGNYVTPHPIPMTILDHL